jgi:CRISPR/Cas system-associated exonuclease Cas4 (RecB family)
MPSTTELILEWDRKRPRSKQKTLGMSDLGGCRRRAGYVIAGQEPTNPGGSVQAAMGSAIHDAIADILADLGLTGVSHENEVKFAGLVGHYDRIEDDVAIDVKTTSSRWLEHLKMHGPSYAHVWQVSCYAAALIHDKHTIRRIRIDYLARDTGEEWSWSDRFDPRHVRDALYWLKMVRETPLGMLPRDYEPDSAFCRGCKFLQVCWEGALPNRNPLSVLFVEDPDAERWAKDLWEARASEKASKKAARVALGALDAIRPPEGLGRVQCGPYTLDFRSNGVYFVAGDAPVPAVGYDDGEAA